MWLATAVCVIRVKWIVGTEVQCKCNSLCSVRVNMMEGQTLVTIGQKAMDQICDTVLSWFNRRGQLIFHLGPGRFGQLFSLNKFNHHLKTAFCIYLHYLCVILKFVWSESFKCDKYAKKTNKKTKQEGGKNLFTALYTHHTFFLDKWIFEVKVNFNCPIGQVHRGHIGKHQNFGEKDFDFIRYIWCY